MLLIETARQSFTSKLLYLSVFIAIGRREYFFFFSTCLFLVCLGQLGGAGEGWEGRGGKRREEERQVPIQSPVRFFLAFTPSSSSPPSRDIFLIFLILEAGNGDSSPIPAASNPSHAYHPSSIHFIHHHHHPAPANSLLH